VSGTSSSAVLLDGACTGLSRRSQCFDGGLELRAFSHAAAMQHVAFTSGVRDDRRPDDFCARESGFQGAKEEVSGMEARRM
jgi:hypothetical protein